MYAHVIQVLKGLLSAGVKLFGGSKHRELLHIEHI